MQSMNRAPWLSAIILLFMTACLFSPFMARGAEWRQVGYGTLEDKTRFDVYVDTDSILDIGGKVRFWQGHVFYSVQPLPTGGGYMRVNIERVVDCAHSSDSNIRAIFYGGDDTVLQNYEEDILLKPVGSDTIRQGVLRFVCEYEKN